MAKKRAGKKKPRRVTIDYIKGHYFRVIHADGALGGVSAHGQIHMDFWNQRAAIPQSMAFAVDSEGQIGKELIEERKVRSDLIREVESSVIMDLPTAKAFYEWLGKNIKILEKAAQG